MPEHDVIVAGEIHIPYNWTYADTTARTGAAGFISTDVGKLARQTDDNSLWMLTATTPTWVPVGYASGFKASVRAATTAALAAHTRSGNVLTASANGAFPAQDGVTLVLNERILVKDEAGSHLEHGIYYLSQVGDASNPWKLTRATDADESSDVKAGLLVVVNEGTANADTIWLLTTNDPITLNTTALAFVNPTVAQASGAFAFTGDITPSQITSDQNDYNPTGLSTASTLRLDTDANSGAGRSITGLAGGADGRIIIIHNVGSNPLRLKSENVGSSASNRFSFAVDIVLGSKRSVTLQYDSTSSRWRLLHTTAIPLRHTVAISDESTAIATGTAKLTFRFATAVYLLQVRANLKTVSSSGNPAFDVNEAGVSIFSTTLTIDANENSSETAATAAVISDPNIADDAEMTVDIDTAGTGAKGAKLTFIGWEI
jgi:hypothetical protein